MSLMMGKLYSALRAANVPDDAAREAAEEAASRDADIADLKSDIRLLKWMVSTVAVLQIATLMGLLSVLWRLAGRQ